MTIPIPEPVAFAAGGHPNHLCSRAQYNSMLGKNRIKFDVPLITTDQAEAYAVAKVREALEEAAQSCTNTLMMNVDSYCGATAHMCADRIRAMIPTDPRPGQP